jgi:hypothetical protein
MFIWTRIFYQMVLLKLPHFLRCIALDPAPGSGAIVLWADCVSAGSAAGNLRSSGYSMLMARSTIIANSSAAAKMIGAASCIVNRSAVFGWRISLFDFERAA